MQNDGTEQISQQDANEALESSANAQEMQNTQGSEASSSQAENTQTQGTQGTQGTNGTQETPNGGLPPKENLYGEFRRKILEEIVPVIQGAVRESTLGLQTQNAQKPEIKYQGKYGKAELERIVNHPDANEQDKLFATRGLAYIEAREDTMSDINQSTEKQQTQIRQSQALQSIVKDYPQVYNAQTGQWNFADPLWQKAMQVFNSNYRLRSFGNEGLRVAMDSAFAQMTRENQAQLGKKQVKLTTQQRAIDRNQSQAMSAGSLTPIKSGSETNQTKLWEAYKQNPDDPNLRTAALGKFIPKNWLQ